MAWKSTTFKTSNETGRFLPKGGNASGQSAPGAGKADGTRSSGAKTNGRLVVKDAGAVLHQPAADAKAASSQAVAKHRNAMTGVIAEAKRVADERREALDSIKDPELKRSAAR